MVLATLANQHRPVNILLIEDNYGDILLAKEAFSGASLAHNIYVASDGEQALEMLRKEGRYANLPTPDMILLDLNLPKKDGHQVLEEIKQDEALRCIPVAILSSSRAENDVEKSYQLHANSYIVKPPTLDSFTNVIRALENFWFTMVIMPDPKALATCH
ncbi:MAG: response regulator [Alphaproteobacteria bacterium]|nr:response regulator [Alphaproteobacteria bacterium]